MKHFKNTTLACLVGAFVLAATPAFSEEDQSLDPAMMKMPSLFWQVQLDELEQRKIGDEVLDVWNGNFVIGKDELKLRLSTKGELDERTKDLLSNESQLSLQVPVSDFFDASAGVRLQEEDDSSQTQWVLGVSGLAPQWFEVGAQLVVGEDKALWLELDAEYDFLLSNYLTLATSFEANVALNDQDGTDLGTGLRSSETGIRLRYDLKDKLFSPYIGWVNEQAYGRYKAQKLAAGHKSSEWLTVIGFRSQF